MTDDRSSIQLGEFERIQTAAGTSLLRIVARSYEREAFTGPATLVIDDGDRLHRLAALPSQPAAAGEVAVSYSVSTTLLASARAFSLELGDNQQLPLPQPTVVGEHLEAPHHAIDELARQLQELRADAEERFAQATAAQAQAIARVAELEVELDAAHTIGAELHATLAAFIGSATQLADVTAERDDLKGQLGQSTEALARVDARLDRLIAELSIAAAARIDAEEAVAQLQGEVTATRSDRRVAERGAEEERSRALESSNRASALEAELAAAREVTATETERVAVSQAELESVRGQVAALEGERAALTRRLADLTEQLTQAIAARIEAETAVRDLRSEFVDARSELEVQGETADRRVAEIEAQLGRSSVRLARLMNERHEAERERRELATELDDAREALQRALAGAQGSPTPNRPQELASAPAPQAGSAAAPLIDQERPQH